MLTLIAVIAILGAGSLHSQSGLGQRCGYRVIWFSSDRRRHAKCNTIYFYPYIYPFARHVGDIMTIAQAYTFISYVRENSDVVDRLANDLRGYGVKVWLDRNEYYAWTILEGRHK